MSQELLSQITDENDRRLLIRLIDRYYALRVALSERQMYQMKTAEFETKERELTAKLARCQRFRDDDDRRFQQLRAIVHGLVDSVHALAQENNTLRERNAALELGV